MGIVPAMSPGPHAYNNIFASLDLAHDTEICWRRLAQFQFAPIISIHSSAPCKSASRGQFEERRHLGSSASGEVNILAKLDQPVRVRKFGLICSCLCPM